MALIFDAKKRKMKHQFIAIEGNIGAGKTTLTHLLAQHFNAKTVLEEFAENPFLTKFYENPKQYAFPLDIYFYLPKTCSLFRFFPTMVH